MNPAEWPVAFFDDDYLTIYRPQLSAERTSAEADFLERALGLAPGAELLDLACGFGRHTIEMARRGYRMTGVDFNPRYLAIAAEEARAAGVEARWVEADMRALGFDDAFDGAYSYFTSFGYFSDAENEQVVERVARAIRPGGWFVLDVVNRDRILTHPQQRIWNQQSDGSLLMEEATLDLPSSRVASRQVLIPAGGGAQIVKTFDLRTYTCAELSAMFRRHGLETREVWGGADGSAYSTESWRLILLAGRDGVRT
jgi:SAM-dependent methyltransferase